jgi:hypothetical protein
MIKQQGTNRSVYLRAWVPLAVATGLGMVLALCTASGKTSVPTDCPQRGERAGWMGDMQAFSQTAVFNMDMASFLSKWVRGIRDGQAEDGRFPDTAPVTVDPNRTFSGVPAWGDAGIVVPWRVYQNYGDERILEEQFQATRYERLFERIRTAFQEAFIRDDGRLLHAQLYCNRIHSP